jgi:hypothetical protein
MTKCQGIWYKAAGDIIGSGSRALGGQRGMLDQVRGILNAIGSVSGDVGEGCGRCEAKKKCTFAAAGLNFLFACHRDVCVDLHPNSEL